MKKAILLLSVSIALAQNYSLSFDGVDDYVNLGSQTSYDLGLDDFSLTAFIKPSTNSQNGRVICRGITSNQGSYQLNIDLNGKLRLSFNNLDFYSEEGIIQSNQWQQIAMIRNGETIKGYVDGIIVINENSPILDLTNQEPLVLGIEPGYGSNFNGEIDEVSIWSKALSQEELLTSASNLSISEHHLIGFWKMNIGSGDILYDHSGNQNHGAINGATWSTDVPTSLTYVPDDNFEQALIDLGYDDVLDDLVYTENINGLTNLNLGEKGIVDLTGIQDFISLAELSVRFNQLTVLDVTNLTSLTNLDFVSNQLTTIDLSNNTSLQYLYAENNQLTEMNIGNINSLLQIKYNYNQLHDLDLTLNTSLKMIECTDNDLTSINLSGLVELEELVIFQNSLTNLDVSDNINLKYLNLGDNPVGTLDVSSNTYLNDLRCFNNNLLSLDVSNNTLLTYLEATNNSIVNIDLSNNPLLQSVYCNNNQLTSLDISNNIALQNLYCNDNQLTSLDLASNSSLLTIICTNNQLSTIDLSNLSNLSTLRCDDNQLTNINASNNSSLQILDASANDIVSVSIHPNVPEVRLQNNSITQIDLSNNIGLRDLSLEGNSLTSLDLSSNVLLNELRCNNNQLTSLDVSSNPNLLILLCMSNQISDLTLNTAIQNLYCDNNQLTNLDVSQTNLNILSCGSNQLTYLNIKTLENQLNSFSAQNNSLTCIETLDPEYASSNWTENIDDGVTFEFICGSEERTNWHVSNTGSDISGSATLISPLFSIQMAINLSTDGDTVSVAAGTYYENIDFMDKNISVLGNDKHTTIIDGGGLDVVVKIENGNSPRFENFTVTNGYSSENSVAAGIYTYGNDATIKNIIIKNNQGAGIHSYGVASPSRYENLLVHGNQLGIRTGMNNEFVNCTVVNNSGLGIWSLSSNFSLINCIVAGNTEGQVRFRNADSPSQITVNYSNIEGLESGIDLNNNGTLTWGQGNVNVVPMFVDAENGDFNLFASSMLINAGHPDSTDSDGSRSDIGAYSYYNSYSGPIWYVTTEGNNIDGTGSNESKFASIQAAINFASNGDSISVASGTYYENINMRSKIVMVVGDNYQNTIIDGNQSGSVITFMNNAHGALLKNFTIQNGQAIYDPSEWKQTFGAAGGGIRTAGSRPFLENLIIKNNSAHLGGGIYFHGGNLSDPIRTKFKNVVIVNNTAAKGGGIYCQDDVNDIFYGVSIINNLATDQNGGGGINSNWNSPVTIVNSIITGNETIISGENVPNQLAVNGGQCSFTVSFSNIDGGQEGVFLSNTDSNQLLWGVGNVGIDSKMENIGQGKYNLLASSMLVNAGHPDSLDSDGTIADIGAFPYLNTFSGPTWYVKTDGSDLTGKGSDEEPFGSIQSAINFSDNGDSVSVLAGTFYEHINTKGKNIDIVGHGPGVSIIDGSNSGRVVDISGAMYFSGFTIQNGSGGNQYQRQDRGGGMLISEGNDGGAIISNCLFTDNVSENPYWANGSHVKFGQGAPSTFINCSFMNGASQAPIFTDHDIKGATFINCFIDADGSHDAVTGYGSPSFINCTVLNYTGFAYKSYGTGNAAIINSVFLPANGFPDAKVAPTENVENIQIIIDYSIFPEEGISHSTETGSVTYGNNNITGYPVFVDTTAGDYRLDDLSPAISAGTPSIMIDEVNYNAPNNDLEGNVRPNPSGSNPDMGAYESVKGVDPNYNGPLWYVDASLSLPYGNGGPGGPFTNIQDGINAATDGDTILVKTGIYYEHISFLGKKILIIGEDKENTIINGFGSGRVVTFNSGEDNNSILKNFTIEDGSSVAFQGDDGTGGGIKIGDNTGPIIDNCIIRNNISSTGGGGISFSQSNNAIVKNTMIINNIANGCTGGGILANINASGPFLENVVIAGNITDSTFCDQSGGGGGIYSNQSAMNLNKVTVHNNESYLGGGIYVTNGSDIQISNTSITGNSPQAIHAGHNDSWQLSSNISISYSNIEGGLDSVRLNGTPFSQVDTSNTVSTLVWGLGNTDTKPEFVDAANNDFSLLASSKLINAGDINLFDNDGTRLDIGAFSYFNSYTGPNWYVSNDGNNLTATGSVGNPFRSIQAALNFGNDGDSAYVSSGIYTENIVYRRDESESIRSVSLVGEGKETTIIDGQGIDICIKFPMNGYSSTSISGFTIRNGYADGNMVDHAWNRGGGISIYQNYNSIKLKDLIINNCTSTLDGGGIYSHGSALEMDNISLLDNTADALGGGISFITDNPEHTLTILNTNFNGNSSDNGGALFLDGGETLITNSQFLNNNSSGAGGGLYFVSGDVLIKESDIMNNYAVGSGGGIFEDHTNETNLKIVESKIVGNISDSDGGGIGLSNGGSTIIRRTVIAKNQSNSWGSGIFTNHEFELSNSIISENSGNPAISFHSDNNVYIVNSIIRDNPDGNIIFDIYSQSEETDIVFSSNSIEGRLFEVLYSDNNTGQITDATLTYDYDPEFIDPENGNYEIFSSSLLINAGHSDSLDLDGTRADVGVYPFLNNYSGPNWYVSENGDSLSGNGEINSPFNSIQAALNFANDGDTANIANGTYNESLDYRTHIGKSVNLIGESLESTIIDPNQDGHGIRIGSLSESSIKISNLTIQNSGGENGAGINVNGLNLSPIIIENLHIKNCISTTSGGGIAITSKNTNFSMEEILIENNYSERGAGIYFSPFGIGENSILSISNSTIRGNSSSSRGGGIYINNGGNLEINNSELTSNIAGELGGGLYAHNGIVGDVNNTQIRENIAPEGAGFFIETSSFNIERSVFFLNEGGHGSALEMFQSNIDVVNSNFINNINNNEWGLNSGAIFLHSSPSNFKMINSIVNNNADFEIVGQYPNDGINEIFIEYSSINGGNNFLFSGNSNIIWGDGNVELDPLLIDLGNNNYQLEQDSPLIDAGHPDSLDIDGTRSDIGAYSYDQTGLPLRTQNLSTVQNNQRIELTWDMENEDEVSLFNIYRSFDVNENWYDSNPHSTTTSPIYVEDSPSPDQTYFYRVSAVDSDGDEGLLGFMEHYRLDVDSSSILLKGFDGTVHLDQLIIPGEVEYTLEGFFKYTNDDSNVDIFGFQTELVLKKSVEGDSIRLTLDLPQIQESSVDQDLFHMVDTSSWHHVAIVGNEENTVVWIDGTPAITTTYLVYGEKFSFSSGQQIDEMRFSYSSLYHQPFVPVAGFDLDETTFGYWKMNEGSLDSEFPAFYDISGNSNHIALSEIPGQLNESLYMLDVPHRNDIENAITINEIMPNPVGSDGGKEWFEIYNGWFTPIYLNGWTLEGGTSTEIHVVDGFLKIPCRGYGLLGQTSNIETNGGYDPNYEYGTTISLSNFGEVLSIKDGSGQTIDAVDFDDTFPFSSGTSMELIRPDYDNSLAENWLAAGLSYGESGNMGTPGDRNAAFSGTFSLALNELDYGYVTEGTESSLTFWIFNNGVAELAVDSMINNTQFFTLAPTSGILPPEDSLEVSVTFSPQAVEVYSDTVKIYTGDPYNPFSEIILTGNSINEFADIVVNGDGNDSLSSYQFPFTRLGFSRTLRLNIVNIGTSNLEIEEIILEGDTEFSIDLDASILSFLDTLSMSVVYEPTEEGSNSGTLIFGSNDPDEPSYIISLFGQAAENITLFVPSEYPTISAAIDSAYQQDTIEVAPGTYSGGISLLNKNLVFRGGGDPNETMLQGDGTGPVLTIDGGQNSSTKISNFTVLGGGGTQGGGIKIDGGSNPILDHVIVTANAASGSGGGIAILSGGANMFNMTIAYNSSVGNGGALYASAGSSVNIYNSILFGNGASEIGSFGNVATNYSIVSGGLEGEGNLDVDPLFVNGPALNFTLNWESMAIDAADPEGDLDLDGTIMDMGALPYDQMLQPPDAVTDFSGTGGNRQIELMWGYPLDPRGNANGDIEEFVIMRAIDATAYDTLTILEANVLSYLDSGEDGYLINGQEYHYIVIPRDTSNLFSLVNDTLTLIPAGGTIAFADGDTINDFGSVDHDQVSVWEFLVENTGNGDLNLSSIQLSSEWYGVSESSMLIPAFTTDTLLVTFNPDLTSGVLLDTMVITTDDLDAQIVEIELSGTSSWPVLVLSENELDYGSVRVDLIETLVLDISNNGTDTLFVDSVFVQDTLSGFFVDISEQRTSSRIANVLRPSLSKKRDNAISVNRSRIDNQSPKIITGEKGINTIQDYKEASTIQIGSTSNVSKHVGLNSSIYTMGEKQLLVNRNTQSRIHLSVEVMPGESIGLDVSFSRSDTSIANTTLEIISDDPLGYGDLSIPINGRSVAPVLSLSGATYQFGNVLDSSEYIFTITNTGTDTLTIDEFIAPLDVFNQVWTGPTTMVLDPGASGELTITFSPQFSGYYEENLTILSDTYITGSSIIELSGLKIPTQNIDFSGVLIGEDSVQVLSFENNGNVDLAITSITVENLSEFSTDVSSDLILPVDEIVELNVKFQPSIRGPVSGNITFTTPSSPGEIVAANTTGEGWLPPTAEFSATSISVVTYQGNDSSFELKVLNDGDYPLNYSTTVSADFAGWVWLEAPATGQIYGTSDSTIVVGVVNTANLDPGIYDGSIYFDTNTGENPSELISNTHVMDIFLNLLGDDSEITDTTITVPPGNTPPITFNDDNGESIGLILDFANSNGGTVTVQGVSTLPPVDENTPFEDPDDLLTDPVYPEQYYEISTDIEGSFITDISLSYNILPGINSANTLRIAKRPGNSGTLEPWQVIAVSETEVDTLAGQVVAKNQSSFSQWALISNSTDNSFTDTKGPTTNSLSLDPVELGVLVDAQVSVSVYDDTEIESVTLYYTLGGSETYSSAEMVNSGNSVYSGTIPGSSITQNGLLYYVISQDVLGFSSVTDTLGASVNFASGTLTTNSASGSGYQTGLPIDAWRLISTPAILDETGLTQVFDELGTQDNSIWRVFRYDNVSGTYKDNPVDLNNTESYWIYQKTEENLTIDTPSGKTGNMSGTDILLKTGWNFIGSPYPFKVAMQLDQVQFYGPITYGISGENWSPVVSELDPWNGYVVYNRMSTDQVINLDPSTVPSTVVAKKMEENGWLMSLSLKSGNYGDYYNSLGVLETAGDELEWHDNPEIRTPGVGVSLFFRHNDHQIDLTSDIREPNEQVKIWDMHISSETFQEVELCWSIVQDVPTAVDIRLVDLTTREIINLKSKKKLSLGTLDSRYDRLVKIVAGDEAEVALKISEELSLIPEKLSVSGNYPNPFNPSTTIRYELPGPRNVKMTIVNLKGQQIAELINGWMEIGRHEVIWDGRSDDGSSLSSGIYFVIISDGNIFKTHKIMLLK